MLKADFDEFDAKVPRPAIFAPVPLLSRRFLSLISPVSPISPISPSLTFFSPFSHISLPPHPSARLAFCCGLERRMHSCRT